VGGKRGVEVRGWRSGHIGSETDAKVVKARADLR